MEQEGIYYFFKHEKGKHTLVLADSPQGYDVSGKEVPYAYGYAGESAPGRVTQWVHQYQFVSGKYAQTDYNFKDHPPAGETQPAKLLETSTPGQANPKLFDPGKYELFDYPGEYDSKDEDQAYSQVCMEEAELPYNTVSGSSFCEFFSTGRKFSLVEHPTDAENAEYAITSIHHVATRMLGAGGGEQGYSNTFTCIPADVAFRPARITPRPAIFGAQTAVVVGPSGSEIHTDEFGRVRVQFFWDRYNTRRRHSAIGQITPNSYENTYAAARSATLTEAA